ncbi:hypothetical protein [Luteimonas sp. A649]
MSTYTTAAWLAPLALVLLAGCGRQDEGTATPNPSPSIAGVADTAFVATTLPALDPTAVARCSIDKVDGQPKQQGPHAATGTTVLVEGWVADAALKVPAEFSVVLTGTGTYAVRSEAKVAREDVASVLGSPDLAMSGFGVSGSLAQVPAGEYTIELLVAHGDGRHSLCATGARLAVDPAG